MRLKIVAFFIFLIQFHIQLCSAETYDATVKNDSGTYKVPVEVEDDEVTQVHWPNGGNMHLHGADLDETGDATGYNSNGERISINVDDYEIEKIEEAAENNEE